MTQCTAPYCQNDAKFNEPNDHGADFEVCKKHVDPTKDGITRHRD